MKKYTTMKTENQSNPNRNFWDRIGFDLILKPNQLDEQITKQKRLDRMVFSSKNEPIQSANTLVISHLSQEHYFIGPPKIFHAPLISHFALNGEYYLYIQNWHLIYNRIRDLILLSFWVQNQLISFQTIFHQIFYPYVRIKEMWNWPMTEILLRASFL